MIIDCISDLHGYYPKLEGGDLLIVAGDCTATDSMQCWDNFFKWFDKQNYKKKIYISGNHDNFLTQCCNNVQCADIVYSSECEKQEYLCDSGTEFEGLKIYGSPWCKTFVGMNPHCKAFTVDTEEELAEKWALIPNDIDILITHSPPFGFFDRILRQNKWGYIVEYTGSLSLRNQVMDRIKPQIHIFGHIHEWGGKMVDTCTTKFVNASHVNEYYRPVNQPIRIVI